MSDSDLAPLPEDVSGHCLGPRHTHADGRWCSGHHRLNVWVTDGYQQCLREHPSDPRDARGNTSES